MTTITPADASEIIAVIVACHHRTAPRMDDPEASRATATIWAELLNGHGFTTDELIAAVKTRAQILSDAPEPADLIRVARANRNDDMGRAVEPDGSIGELTNGEEWDGHQGDLKAADDPGDYPSDWTSEQRLSAYWYAVRLGGIPATTAGWAAIEKQLKRHQEHQAQLREDADV